MFESFDGGGSYITIIVILILTGCGLPLPEEVPIIAAGVASSLGKMNVWMALASCMIGALAGDSVLYAIGRTFGRNLVKAHPRLAQLLHADREAKMEALINRHGLKVLFVARFMVLVRGPVYLSIGILRHDFRKFLIIDAFCASAVVGLFFGLSYAFGDHVTSWIRNSELVFTVLVAIGVTIAGIVLWLKRGRIAEMLGGEELAVAIAPAHPPDDTPTAAEVDAAQRDTPPLDASHCDVAMPELGQPAATQPTASQQTSTQPTSTQPGASAATNHSGATALPAEPQADSSAAGPAPVAVKPTPESALPNNGAGHGTAEQAGLRRRPK